MKNALKPYQKTLNDEIPEKHVSLYHKERCPKCDKSGLAIYPVESFQVYECPFTDHDEWAVPHDFLNAMSDAFNEGKSIERHGVTFTPKWDVEEL